MDGGDVLSLSLIVRSIRMHLLICFLNALAANCDTVSMLRTRYSRVRFWGLLLSAPSAVSFGAPGSQHLFARLGTLVVCPYLVTSNLFFRLKRYPSLLHSPRASPDCSGIKMFRCSLQPYDVSIHSNLADQFTVRNQIIRELLVLFTKSGLLFGSG